MMQSKDSALNRFIESVTKEPEEKTVQPAQSMVANVLLQRGNMIVVGEVSPETLERVLGRKKKAA